MRMPTEEHISKDGKKSTVTYAFDILGNGLQECRGDITDGKKMKLTFTASTPLFKWLNQILNKKKVKQSKSWIWHELLNAYTVRNKHSFHKFLESNFEIKKFHTVCFSIGRS